MLRNLVTGLLMMAAFSTQAQGYPTKPIRLIVPFPPAGTADVLARIIGQRMGESLGQQIVVDLRPGASGSLGAALTAKAAPDGYTAMLTSLSPLVINVHMFSGKAQYDPQKDLAPISLVTKVPSVITVHSTSALRSVKDLIAAAKASPGKLTYGSSGSGGVNHLITELFRSAAGIELTHVPYKGAGPAMIALLSKEIDISVASPVAIMSQVRAGQVRALAVSGAVRSPALADVPTIAEAAIPGFDSTAWYAMLAPAGAPRAYIDKLNGALVQAMRSPLIVERLNAEGAAPEPTTPEGLRQLIQVDSQRWAKAVKLSGAKLE